MYARPVLATRYELKHYHHDGQAQNRNCRQLEPAREAGLLGEWLYLRISRRQLHGISYENSSRRRLAPYLYQDKLSSYETKRQLIRPTYSWSDAQALG